MTLSKRQGQSIYLILERVKFEWKVYNESVAFQRKLRMYIQDDVNPKRRK